VLAGHRTDVRRPLSAIIPGTLALVTAAFAAADLMADRGTGASAAHLTLEIALFVAAACAGAALIGRARAEARRSREEKDLVVRGVSESIERQFEAWHATAAEREVGMLLLKGLSHKEIGQMRETGEATVRQQAFSLYRKANVTGRAELSAYFLEDLLPPVG
jgi:DNA-binding NarL/FixJ family response regulator